MKSDLPRLQSTCNPAKDVGVHSTKKVDGRCWGARMVIGVFMLLGACGGEEASTSGGTGAATSAGDQSGGGGTGAAASSSGGSTSGGQSGSNGTGAVAGGSGGSTSGGQGGSGGEEATGGSSTGGEAVDQELVGWASVAACGPQGTTGGGDGEPTITVSSGAALRDALTSSGPLVIAVSGTFASPGAVSGVTDKTLVGINDAEVSGGFRLNGARNVVIKNIRFSDGAGTVDDTVEISGSECLWFDHCEFIDGSDGNLDIVRGSDLITVSWSKFYYTRGHDHMLSNLCGNSQPREEDEGKINITFHHNWWGAGVRSRTPRVRYGQVHVFNNYYRYEPIPNDGGEVSSVAAGFRSKLLVENNYFDSRRGQIIWQSDEETGEVVERGNEVVNFARQMVTRGSSFVPPYEYTLDPAAQVPDLVMAGAGRH